MAHTHTPNNAFDQSELMNFYCYVKTRKFVNIVTGSLFWVRWSFTSLLLLGVGMSRDSQSIATVVSLHFLCNKSERQANDHRRLSKSQWTKKRIWCQLVIRSVYYFDCLCVPQISSNRSFRVQFSVSHLITLQPVVQYFENHTFELRACGRHNNSFHKRINEVNSRFV